NRNVTVLFEMALFELKQYENVIFPNLDILQKTVKDIHTFNRTFNDLIDIRAKESLKMSIDLDDFIEYFRMLSEDNVTVDDLLQMLIVLKDMIKNRKSSAEELRKEFEKFKSFILNYVTIDVSQSTANDDDLEDVSQTLMLTDGRQQHSLVQSSLNSLYQIFLEGIKPSIIYYTLTYTILPNSQNNSSLYLAIAVFAGCYIYNRKAISRNVKDLIKRIRPNKFNGKSDTILLINKREQNKYKEKISAKLPVVLTHLEIVKQFWKQQFDIFESHIIAL
ncbi:18661_t:CDS:2, partial [Funneliformis geosporum]